MKTHAWLAAYPLPTRGFRVVDTEWSTQHCLQAVGTGWIVGTWSWHGWFTPCPEDQPDAGLIGAQWADQGARIGFGTDGGAWGQRG